MIGSAQQIFCRQDNRIWIRALKGHFAMTNSHANYYVDIMEAKLNVDMAENAAELLARNYAYSQVVDTILCMDGSEIIGAFLAQKLAGSGIFAVNEKKSIYVVAPENEHSRQMILRDNTQPMVRGKKVLVLAGSILTGKNARKAIECVSYYGGSVVGVGAVYSILNEVCGLRVISLFDKEDIPGYQAVEYADCALCKAGEKIDALANCYGYSRI